MDRFSGVGGKGKVSEMDSRETIRYWQSRPIAERLKAIFEIRDFYYEVLHPGTGAKRMDRSVGGTRKLGD